MAKGIFVKYRGTMTQNELHEALKDTKFRENSIDILNKFFVEGRTAKEMGYPRNRVNNTIDRFLQIMADK